ncbi:polyphosphate polymerase domain-containing protein [Cellulomonas palmilytica]|uniref:polyphosphate polymerase domain-containing protein n=1 Tax=Cellulomonas palmilytica TaxID=2608402 RepID=UPI001F1E958D|nr:polyphosphate polymerase domain-containing protein [Cellulomonas palmilytica]UJP40069.1 polyphosphate polymerase domain-containing protein [Cellulomonas palmilytica]
MTATVDDLLRRLAPVSLEELIAAAELQTRVDRKYLLPVGQVDPLVVHLADTAQVLEIGTTRLFDYESVYFDTPDLLAYRLAATRRRRRFKVRTRSYLDSAQCWLEVKTRGPRGATVKDRLPYELRDRLSVAPGRWYVSTVLDRTGVLAGSGRDLDDLVLRPVLVTRYLRTTLLLPGTASRVTIDTGLRWDDGTRSAVLDGLAVVETKTGSTASAADRALWSLGHRPVRVSKYATGLAALRPELPSHRWRRTLHRLAPHLEPAPDARE